MDEWKVASPGRDKERRRSDKAPAAAVGGNRHPADPTLDHLRHELQVYKIELELRTEELHCMLAELEASRSKYFDLYDLAPVGYFTLDQQGVILEANGSGTAMLGVAREALVTRPMSDFVLPEDRNSYFYLQGSLVEAGLAQGGELRMLRADGSPFWVHVQSVVVREQSHARVATLVTLTDIDQRKQYEAEILRDKALLRCIIDSTGDLMYVKDTGGVYQACNKAYEAFAGQPVLGQTGRTDFDLFAAEQAKAVRQSDQQVLRHGTQSRTEEWVRYPDGSWALLDSLKTPYYGPDGEQLGLVGISRDITERLRIEKALHASEEQFRTLCDAAPIGIFRSDRSGTNVYCNPRWAEITGIPASEGMGEGWFKGIHPDDSEAFGRFWLEALAKGRRVSHEHRQLPPQGAMKWLRVLVSPIVGEDGALVSYVGTLEDITAQQQARHDLSKNQKLESLGVLAGGIAHDFNNMLLAVFGNISLARFHLEDPESLGKRLDDAEKAIERATSLTKQLLTFARGGAPVKKVVGVRELLQGASDFALHGSGMSCQFDLEEGLWPVEADEGQLTQAIQNLILNGVQAMPEGGTLTIRGENVSSRTSGGRYVRISVTDTGIGISETDLSRIFDPYFSTKPQGSGMGLATCHSIIRKHAGKIRAASDLGKGSTFTLSLPASDQLPPHQTQDQTVLIRGSGRILVMDDDEAIRAVALGMLKELGYSVELAKNGAEAVDLYRKGKLEGRPFSAVVLDLTIPGGMGGRETIESLLKIDPGVKAIVSSGYCHDPVMAHYRDYGFAAVLSKPYRPQEMSSVLWELTAS